MTALGQKPQAVLKILEELDGIGQWREEQFQRFQEKQIQKSPNLIVKSSVVTPEDSQHMDQHKENLNPTECQNQISFYSNTTADSSVTGHILRCFGDSTENSPIISNNSKKSGEIANIEAPKATDLHCASSKKPTRPFLRKGSGLIRYYKPKSAKQVKTSNNNPPEHQVTPFVQFSQVRKPVKCFPNSALSQQNISEQRKYVQTESSTLNKNIGFDIHTSEQLRDYHTNVDDQINLNRAGKEKTSVNYKKCDFAVSDIDGNLKPDVQYGDKEKGQTSLSSRSASEIAGGCVDDAELNPIVGNNTDGDNLNKSEDSLADFEILEKCAQNSSFNSDCSVVQRAVRGECLMPGVSDKAELKHQYSNTGYFSESPFSSLNISKFRDEALAKRKQLESNFAFKEQIESVDATERQVRNNEAKEKEMESNEIRGKKIESINAIMSDNKRILGNLQKEITPNNEGFSKNENFVNERCSTPVDVPQKLANPLCSNLDTDVASNYLNADYKKHEENQQDPNLKTKETSDALLRNSFHLIENEVSLCDNHNSPNLQQSEIKEKMKQKIDQLQKEIEIYQEYNAQLAKKCKERNEVARKLKMEYDSIEKYKAEQKEKISEEIEKERQQIKRERENFQRLKKMQKENLIRTEREELSALRKENEKLQEELKRQKIKFTSDTRRIKNQLNAAENERDESKRKVISLEEQVDDLLNVVRARNSKRKTSKSMEINKSDHIEESLQHNVDLSTVDCTNSSEKTNSAKSKIPTVKASNKSVKVSSSKPRVRFNLTPQFESSQDNTTSQVSVDSIEDHPSNELEDGSNNRNETEDNSTDNTTKNIENHDSPISEINNSKIQFDCKNQVERILPSGETEIIQANGTKITIKPDGSTYVVYPNGETKYRFPDKHESHRFVNGVVEDSFPDGSKITKFPDGQVEYLMPDGIKQNDFPDGDCQIIYPDGTQVIQKANGKQMIVKPDGTIILYCDNGDTEIRTSTYKKREFADGSVRILYSNGRRETRYPNGRIRIKDADGRIILDTKFIARK